jgi:hypothetical protein
VSQGGLPWQRAHTQASKCHRVAASKRPLTRGAVHGQYNRSRYREVSFSVSWGGCRWRSGDPQAGFRHPTACLISAVLLGLACEGKQALAVSAGCANAGLLNISMSGGPHGGGTSGDVGYFDVGDKILLTYNDKNTGGTGVLYLMSGSNQTLLTAHVTGTYHYTVLGVNGDTLLYTFLTEQQIGSSSSVTATCSRSRRRPPRPRPR